MPRSLTVGLLQMQLTDDPQQNLAHALDMARDAAAQGANLICTPELFLSHYFCQTEDHDRFKLAEPVPGPTTETFAELAAELDVTVLVSLFEKRAEGLYHNTMAVVDGKRGYIGKYRKMHIPDDPQYYEKFYFTPGDLGFKAFDTRGTKVGTLICWDQWFPEAARMTAMRGAEVLFYPTAIGWLPEDLEEYGEHQHSAWETIQRSHAVANGCYVCAVNRTGFEPNPGTDNNPGIHFWGQSFIAAPDGRVLQRAPKDEEAILVQQLDLDKLDWQRTMWPFLRDRRIDAYAPLTKRFLDDE